MVLPVAGQLAGWRRGLGLSRASGPVGAAVRRARAEARAASLRGAACLQASLKAAEATATELMSAAAPAIDSCIARAQQLSREGARAMQVGLAARPHRWHVHLASRTQQVPDVLRAATRSRELLLHAAYRCDPQAGIDSMGPVMKSSKAQAERLGKEGVRMAQAAVDSLGPAVDSSKAQASRLGQQGLQRAQARMAAMGPMVDSSISSLKASAAQAASALAQRQG
jgi:hypothetical protein